jgi:hypothetical protein
MALVAPLGLTAAPALAAAAPQTVIGPLNAPAFTRINVIRASFRLPAGLGTTAYSSEVLVGLRLNEDPPFVPAVGGIVKEDGLWGVFPSSPTDRLPSAVDLVNAWVYHDGWQGSAQATWNVDCTHAGAPGCNSHRRAVLSAPPARGARLYIDVTTRRMTYSGVPAVALAALLVWKLPAPSV